MTRQRPPGWAFHPGIRKAEALTRGERAADTMKRALATWTALALTIGVLLIWLLSGGFGIDPSPYFRLNLALSCFAALQCFVLLIANRRGEQIAAELAKSDYEVNLRSKEILDLLHKLTPEIHKRVESIAKEGAKP